MTCTPLPGGLGWACTRGRKTPAPCDVCGKRPHTKLCDYKLTGPRTGDVCDRKLCDECAVHRFVPQSEMRDYCPAHAAREKAAGKP